MLEKVNPQFIRIPNIIMLDKEITPNCKYLYGIIDMLSYYVDTITNDDLSNISQISHNSIEKYLKQLKAKKYIMIERTKNARKITPLILKSLEIATKKDKDLEIEQIITEEQRKKDIEYRSEHNPLFVNEFLEEIRG